MKSLHLRLNQALFRYATLSTGQIVMNRPILMQAKISQAEQVRTCKVYTRREPLQTRYSTDL